jgi:hypothetical protein
MTGHDIDIDAFSHTHARTHMQDYGAHTCMTTRRLSQHQHPSPPHFHALSLDMEAIQAPTHSSTHIRTLKTNNTHTSPRFLLHTSPTLRRRRIRGKGQGVTLWRGCRRRLLLPWLPLRPWGWGTLFFGFTGSTGHCNGSVVTLPQERHAVCSRLLTYADVC